MDHLHIIVIGTSACHVSPIHVESPILWIYLHVQGLLDRAPLPTLPYAQMNPMIIINRQLQIILFMAKYTNMYVNK